MLTSRLTTILALLAVSVSAGTGHRIPVGSGTVGVRVAAVPELTYGRDLPPFGYPPHMERFAWSLQSSTDLATWRTEMTWPAGLAAGGAINIVRDGKHKWYRMQGN